MIITTSDSVELVLEPGPGRGAGTSEESPGESTLSKLEDNVGLEGIDHSQRSGSMGMPKGAADDPSDMGKGGPSGLDTLVLAKAANTAVRKLLARMIPFAKKCIPVYRGDMPSRKIYGQWGREVDTEKLPRLCLIVDVSGSVNKTMLARAMSLLITEISKVWSGRMSLNLVLFADSAKFEKVVLTTTKAVKNNLSKLQSKIQGSRLGGGTQFKYAVDKFKSKVRSADIVLLVSDCEFYRDANIAAKLLRRSNWFCLLLETSYPPWYPKGSYRRCVVAGSKFYR